MYKIIELNTILNKTNFKYIGKRKVWVLSGVDRDGKVVSLLGNDLLDCVSQLGGISK